MPFHLHYWKCEGDRWRIHNPLCILVAAGLLMAGTSVHKTPTTTHLCIYHRLMRTLPDLTACMGHCSKHHQPWYLQGGRERGKGEGGKNHHEDTEYYSNKMLSGGAMFHELKMPAEMYRVLHRIASYIESHIDCRARGIDERWSSSLQNL